MKFVSSLLLAIFALSIAQATDEDTRVSKSHYLSSYFGKSLTVLGSEDNRFGGGVAYGYGKPEPRFTFQHVPAQLVYEGYVEYTQSPGGNGFPPNGTFSEGVLAYSRWRWPFDQAGNGVYFDLGWGLQVADRSTLDLSSQVNSTPVAGFGGVYRSGNKEYLIGVRAMHMSNAGLKQPNFGQNQLLFTIGIRY